MPKAKPKKPPTQPTPAAPVAVDNGLLIVYDKVSINEYSTAAPHGPLTVDDLKTMLGWETEKEYQQRSVKEEGGKPEHYLFGEAGPRRKDTGTIQPVHCVDAAGQKVVCWNNANNRPFDLGWCEDLIHTILHGQWAGPFTFPGETINGETVRVSKYGRVLSGQHQGTACILADEFLQQSRAQAGNAAEPKYPSWNGQEHCFIETVVIIGLSEDERVLRTIDYVKPRTTADMLYTMELFRQNTPVERKEMTRMLSSAIDLLWARTDTQGYKTHPEVVGFLERHKRLLKCVEHLFTENVPATDGGRKISKLRLSAGQASALCYLMASSGPETDGDEYRNMSPPSERGLDWSRWDKAQDFWTCLANSRDFMPVRTALNRLVESDAVSTDNQGLGGRVPEKFAILAKAWQQFRDHPESAGPCFTNDDLAAGGVLSLNYSDLDDEGNKLPEGKIKLLDAADFEGVDCPESLGRTKRQGKAPPMPPPPTREEIEKATQEALARRKK